MRSDLPAHFSLMGINPDFVNELRTRFSGELRMDLSSRILYSTDASIYQIKPLGVAIPRTPEDLHAAVELAVKYRTPILPRGSGSSLGGQAIGEALILDCSRHLDRILEIDPEAHRAAVEPGVILSDLNRAAAVHGLMYGPDPASAERATMGGVIGNNATGAHSILYGMSADHIISANVILGDGSRETWSAESSSRLSPVVQSIRQEFSEAIKAHFPRTWRNSAGYRLNYLLPWSPSTPSRWDDNDYGMATSVYRGDSKMNLAAILAGSEGTLAVMEQAWVNLVPRPAMTVLAVLKYESIPSACDDVPRLLACHPSAVELIPRIILQLARGVPAYARQMNWIEGDPAALLVIEFSGERLEALKAAARNLGENIILAETAEEQALIWNIRKMGLGILDSRPRAARPAAFIEDCAVPVENLGEFIREIERILSEHHTEGGIYAHASAGCLHIRPVLNLLERKDVHALRSISREVFELAARLGGSMSSEHGDGIVAGEWIEETYGAQVTRAMRLLKNAADPHRILNPGKMMDAPPMDSHLRYGPDYQASAWTPLLSFEHERGLAGAIEQCNGQGVCRKRIGVMCPSFQATRDEGNSTRGRANLLRAFISGMKPASGGAGREITHAVFSALDLCLACKGCTAECPSGVDMPKLKYEFLNLYFMDHRRPLRDYLFGYFHVISKIIRPLAPLVNQLMKINPLRWVDADVLGITRQRPFPVFSSRKAHPHLKGGASRQVIFLPDVFSRYLEPEVEQAAFDLLEAGGYEVKVLPLVGAGVSLLSKGFLKASRQHAENVLDEIQRLDGGKGLPIVGCEPPELYCLKNEYRSILPNRREEIDAISRRAWILDEFLLRTGILNEMRVVNDDLSRSPSESSQKVFFHPHCHQQAEGPAADGFPSGTQATVSMLKQIGLDVEILDTGCCGMAGSFGYDAEHFELSMRVGELALLPKARAKNTIVTTGSACRMQIRQGAGVDAIHPILLVRNALQTGKG